MSQQILKAIWDWNPWFEGNFPNELSGYARDYDILQYLQIPEIKILEGARRVGKSTLLYQVIRHLSEQGQKVLYLNFDDEELRKHSLKTLVEVYQEQGEFVGIFLDEIQHCSDWVHYVRNLYDRKQVQQIWISGSNSSLIKKEYKTLLSGRNITLQIHPLSFREYLRFKQCTLPNKVFSTQKEIAIKKHFDNYLRLGAFPAMALRTVYQKELLISYFEDFVYKDIATRYNVNANKLKDLGLYLATNSAKLFSYRSIAASLGIHPSTIVDYFSYYQEVFLFSEMYKFDYSLHGQFGSEKKIYCLDTGLAAAISFRFSDDRGRMLENLVYNQLQRRGDEVYFHKGKKECDFVVKEQLEVTQLIQVCKTLADIDTKSREIQGLIDALKIYPQAQGVILTEDEKGEEQVTIDDKIHIIQVMPIWRWLLL
jgi:hypothetical protein